jgi:hypothetical protein
MKIELRIEELVLHGFPAGTDRHRIARAVEMELQRLLESGALRETPPAGREVAEIRAESFAVGPRATPESIGVQLARTLGEGLRP